jgi:hypothetical protein
MDERRSDPPGAVSDQMPEEQPSGLRQDEQHPEPRTDEGATDAEVQRPAEEHNPADERNEGEAKEGSQSTGHRDNAG